MNDWKPTAHRPPTVLARPVMDTPAPGGAGSAVQVVPLKRSTALPPATQTLAWLTATAWSAPTLGIPTCAQVLPFQRSTSDFSGNASPPAAHTSFAARAATALSTLLLEAPAGSGVGKRCHAVPSQW